MRLTLRSRRNRRRNWTDRIGQMLIGSKRHPLTPAQVMHRALVVVALLLPYLVWNHGQTLVRHARSLQARMEARKAEQVRLAGRADAALSRLMRAYARTPEDPEVIRGIAWSAVPAFPLQGKYFLEKLVAKESATPEDQMLLASTYITLDQPVQAAAVFESLVKKYPTSPDVWRSWAMACYGRGELSEAMKAYRRVLAFSPHDLTASIGIAQLLLRSGTAKDDKAAAALVIDQLDRLVGAKLPGADDLARFLVSIPITDAEQRAKAASVLRRATDLSAANALAAVFLAHPLEPKAGEAASRREEVRRFLAGRPALELEERKAVSLVLEKHGESTLILDSLSLAEAAGDPVLFAQRLEALLSCGLWKEAAEMARHPDAGDTIARQGWLNTLDALSSCREPKNMAAKLLTQSLEDAMTGKHYTACKALGFAALDYGLYPLAARAFAVAIQGCPHVAVPLEEYLLAARRGGSTAGDAMKIIAARAAVDRCDDDLLAQSIYLRLLTGLEIERTALDLAQLRQRNPGDPYLKFLHAFTGFRLGDYAGAVKALLPLPSHRWQQGETVVISTILAAGGQIRQAAQLAGKISGEGVFPEERRMLDAWQSRARLDSGLLSSVTVNP